VRDTTENSHLRFAADFSKLTNFTSFDSRVSLKSKPIHHSHRKTARTSYLSADLTAWSSYRAEDGLGGPWDGPGKNI